MARWRGHIRRPVHSARVAPDQSTNPTPGFGRWARYLSVVRTMGYAVHVSLLASPRPLPELL